MAWHSGELPENCITSEILDGVAKVFGQLGILLKSRRIGNLFVITRTSPTLIKKWLFSERQAKGIAMISGYFMAQVIKDELIER